MHFDAKGGLLCREWSAEEQAVWRERDGQEKAELTGHANAATTSQDRHLPGNHCTSSKALETVRLLFYAIYYVMKPNANRHMLLYVHFTAHVLDVTLTRIHFQHL